MFIRRLYHRLKILRIRRVFKKSSILGEHVKLYPSADCRNLGKRERLTIGDACEIKGVLSLQGDGELRVGNRLYLGGFSYIHACDSIQIGDNVIIANHVRINDNNVHPVEPEKRIQMSLEGSSSPLWRATESQHSPVVIEDNVWIGDFAAVLKGVRVGKGSVIGMHCVVTKDVPAYSVVVGNPARVVKLLTPPTRCENEDQ